MPEELDQQQSGQEGSAASPGSEDPIITSEDASNLQKDAYTSDDLKGLLSALEKEREANRQKDKLLEERAKRDAIYKDIDPVRFKELEDAERRRTAFEAEMKAREQAREERYMAGLREKDQQIERLRQEVVEKEKRQQLEKIFMAAKGRSGSGHNNVSFFDTFYQWSREQFKFSDNGELLVVDSQGNHVIDSETSNRIDPIKYIEKTYKQDEVMSWVFEPEMGAGGGMISNRGRGTTGKDLQNLSKKELYQLGWGS